MHVRPHALLKYTLVLGLVFLFGKLHFAESASPDRVGEIDNNSVAVIRGNVRPQAQPQYDQGPVDGSFRLENIMMTFKPSAAQQDALDKLLAAQLDPSSPNYHRWLTPEQFGDSFGLTRSDLAKIVSWLEDQGFTLNLAARGRTWVSFSGTAAQVSAAFHTETHRYAVNGKMHYANATDPSVPAAMAGVVLGFRSLDDFHPTPRAASKLRKFAVQAQFTSSISGDHFLVPNDFATIYGVQGLYSSGFTGSGERIAVVGQTDVQLSDIQAFRKAAGLSNSSPAILLVPGSPDPGSNKDELIEADLDLEWSGGIAPSAAIIYVNSTDAFGSLEYAIDQNLAPVVSSSYGTCEADAGLVGTDSLAATAKQGNAQGITLLAAAGDSGAADCDEGTPTAPATIATHGLAVDVPASIPYFTGVGGSEFVEGSGTYWSSTNNSQMGSALSYIPESAWNETVADGSLAAGGGGASMDFTKPSWQTGKGVPADGKRDVPDVVLNASAIHDSYLICTSGSCVNGFRAADNTLQAVGGTSAGAPSFAGIVALIDQKEKAAQGNINPTLYALAAQAPTAFHDITSGNNMVPCQAKSPDCPSSGEMGYNAAPGYDLATGLGSVDAYTLASAWTSHTAPPPPDFQLAISPTSLTLSAGGSGSAVVTVTAVNGFDSTVSFACSVPTTLTATTCTVSPSPVTGSGTASLTITAGQSAKLLPRGEFNGPLGWFAVVLALLCGIVAGILRRSPVQPRLGLGSSGIRGWGGLALGAGLACLLAVGISCGGGGSSSSTTNTTPPPPVTGTVTLQGSSGSLSHSATLSVTVN